MNDESEPKAKTIKPASKHDVRDREVQIDTFRNVCAIVDAVREKLAVDENSESVTRAIVIAFRAIEQITRPFPKIPARRKEALRLIHFLNRCEFKTSE